MESSPESPVVDEVHRVIDSSEPLGCVVSRVIDSSEPLGAITSPDAAPVSSELFAVPGPSTSAGLVLGEPESGAPPAKRKHLYLEELRSQWNMEKIILQLGTNEQCLQFAKDKGLVPRTKMCTYHRSPMIIINEGPVGTFKCNKRNCRKPRVSCAKDTWFENVKIPLVTIFRLMYCFASDMTYKQTQRECCSVNIDTAVSQATITDWYNYCRETIVVDYIENKHAEPIGGPGKIVQIDESKFGRRKYNKGRRVEGHWVLGMIEDGSDDLRVVVCPDNVRDAETLIPIIKKHVRVGSTIHTDCWRAYNCLNQHGYDHKTVNHSDPENPFVGPDGTHTQRIESQWRNLKKRFHKTNYKNNFEDWLIEYCWRKSIESNNLDPFEELLKSIINVYKI